MKKTLLLLSAFVASLVTFAQTNQDAGGVQAPTENPTEPKDDAKNVVAIYSATYGKGVKEHAPEWGGGPNPLYSVTEEVAIADDHKVMHVVGTGYADRPSVAFGDEYSTIHVAVYPFTATEAKIFSDNNYANAINVSELKPGEWNYITVNDNNKVVNTNYVLIELVGETEFYLDHFYLVKSESTAPQIAVPVEPTADAANVLAVYSSKYGKEELTTSNPAWGGYKDNTGNDLYASFTYDELTAEDGAKHKVVHVTGTGINSRTLNDVSAAGYNKFHAAIYPTTATSAVIFKDNGYADRVSVTGLIPGQWNYIEKIVDFDNNYVTIALDGETEFYVDHIYFEKVENIEVGGSFTIAEACNDGEKYYGTYYTDKAYVMPEGVEGQIVSVDNNNKLVVTTAYTAGAVVPANTPLLMCASKPGNYIYTATTNEGQTYENNMLHCGNHTGWDTDGKYYFYRLTMHEGKIGFWWGAENGVYFNPGDNKAYLAVRAPQEETAYLVRGFSFDGEATAISNVKAEAAGEDVIYDLSGRRVLSPVKAGIYIVNGKKMVIK